jgi:hypothetical protein
MSKPTRRAPRPEWAAVDVGLLRDPKVAQLSAGDQLAFISAILWTVEQQTDGRLPRVALRLLGSTAAQLGRLVDAGLLDRLDDGWQLRAWDKWQKPRQLWEAEHDDRVAKARLAACTRWHDTDCQCLAGGPVLKRVRPRLVQ